ncbi:hypothetical protein VKT23_013753 [Stygiomarasmius scandens]|uniref:Uncharacterized protein n=1 Tax=Marasmiellus scandens TaxID=2682957 RepID=A0ABR1J3Q0_9AGAR
MSSKHGASYNSDSGSTTSRGHGNQPSSTRSPSSSCDRKTNHVSNAMGNMHIISSQSYLSPNTQHVAGGPSSCQSYPSSGGGNFSASSQNFDHSGDSGSATKLQPQPLYPGYSNTLASQQQPQASKFAAQQNMPPSNQSSQHFAAYPSYPTYEADSVKEFWEPPPSTPAAAQTTFGSSAEMGRNSTSHSGGLSSGDGSQNL